MLNEVAQYRAKNEAADDLVRELLIESFRAGAVQKEAIKKALHYLTGEGGKKGSEAVDLNELFRFIIYSEYLLVIPRERFGENDFVILKNLHPKSKWNAKLIEFTANDFQVNPNVFLPGYLRRCLKRGLHREHF